MPSAETGKAMDRTVFVCCLLCFAGILFFVSFCFVFGRQAGSLVLDVEYEMDPSIS